MWLPVERRDVRVDLAWTADANGNATIQVPLPFTGAWYNLKFALQTTGAPQWAVSISGTTVTHGRGQRVTLGPELIRDGEKVTITMTGAGPAATGTGSANGKAGDPDHIIASFAPQPNTITSEIISTRQYLGKTPTVPVTTVPLANSNNGAGVALILPPGCQAVSLIFDFPSHVSSAGLVGNVTGVNYFQPYLVTNRSPALPTNPRFAVEQDVDGMLTLTIFTNALGGVKVWASAIMDTEVVNLAQQQFPLAVQEASLPTLWQAPNNIPVGGHALALANNGIQVLVNAVAGQNVFLFYVSIVASVANFQLQDTGGNSIGEAAFSDRRQVPFDFHGAALAQGVGFQLQNVSGGASDFFWSVSYSQG